MGRVLIDTDFSRKDLTEKHFGNNQEKVNTDKSQEAKKPSYLHREVEIHNTDEINQKALLSILHERFVTKLNVWKGLALRFQMANFLVTLLVILIQVAQAVIFQMDCFTDQTKTAIATILPAVTSAVLAIQLKLAWTEKSMKAKHSAKMYQKLNNHVEYRLFMIDAGGSLTTLTKYG